MRGRHGKSILGSLKEPERTNESLTKGLSKENDKLKGRGVDISVFAGRLSFAVWSFVAWTFAASLFAGNFFLETLGSWENFPGAMTKIVRKIIPEP